jgi:hypothetical protein
MFTDKDLVLLPPGTARGLLARETPDDKRGIADPPACRLGQQRVPQGQLVNPEIGMQAR